MVKSTLKCFHFIKPSSGLYDGEKIVVKKRMDVFISHTVGFISKIYWKHSFFQAAVVSILLYGCTTWMLTKWLEKKLDGNYTRML